MLDFGNNSVYIIDDLELLEGIIWQAINAFKVDPDLSIFHQLMGKLYITQSVYDQLDKTLPDVDLGMNLHYLEMAEKMGHAHSQTVIKKNIARLTQDNDVKAAILDYFDKGFVIPSIQPDYREFTFAATSWNDPQAASLLHTAFYHDFKDASQTFGLKGLTDNPSVKIYSTHSQLRTIIDVSRISSERKIKIKEPDKFYKQ